MHVCKYEMCEVVVMVHECAWMIFKFKTLDKLHLIAQFRFEVLYVKDLEALYSPIHSEILKK